MTTYNAKFIVKDDRDPQNFVQGATVKFGLAFEYTGAVQQTTLPAGTYSLLCWGAEGGPDGYGNTPGKGGYAEGEITLSEETTLNIYVGGQGSQTVSEDEGKLCNASAGWNGGGRGIHHTTEDRRSGGGGGASDIRIGGTDLADRIIVAAGGGGSAGRYSGRHGGDGGGTTGDTAPDGGTGGTQSAGGSVNGALGAGGDSDGSWSGGGGGGGYYGGGGGGNYYGGGGGSSYIGDVDAGATEIGVREGSGLVLILLHEDTTDENGEVEFEDLEPGEYGYAAYKDGHSVETDIITIDDENITENVTLIADKVRLTNIGIQADVEGVPSARLTNFGLQADILVPPFLARATNFALQVDIFVPEPVPSDEVWMRTRPAPSICRTRPVASKARTRPVRV